MFTIRKLNSQNLFKNFFKRNYSKLTKERKEILTFSYDAQWGKIEIMRPKIKKSTFFLFRLKLIPHYSKLFVDLSMYNVFVLC